MSWLAEAIEEEHRRDMRKRSLQNIYPYATRCVLNNIDSEAASYYRQKFIHYKQWQIEENWCVWDEAILNSIVEIP